MKTVSFIAAATLVLARPVSDLFARDSFRVTSPDGKVITTISAKAPNGLFYSIEYQRKPVILESPIGVRLSTGVYGGSNVTRVKINHPPKKSSYQFPWLGSKSEIKGELVTASFTVCQSDGLTWELEVKCLNNAVAWRAILPGIGNRTVLGELSAWVFPKGSKAWCNPNTVQYEGIHELWSMEAPARHRFPGGIGMPTTIELPWGGYAAITEADIMHYSGMTLEASAPYTLTSSFRDDPRGWTIEGEIVTPWRIVMVAPDLNALVNCDAVAVLCPPPDKTLFPNGPYTDFIKPGRCLWQWWAYNEPGTEWSRQKWFVDQAAALNCQYYLVDEGWENPRFGWFDESGTPWKALKELCDYAASKGVGIWVWRGWTTNQSKFWPGLETQEKREEFFRRCSEIGVKGLKIDFMDSESHERLTFYKDCLRLGAKYKLMINFHGANKPAGEARTWPNELTREGVRGLEYNKWSTLPPHHYTTLPFTRYLAGHGDFTPTTLQPNFLKGTTVALQLATAVVYTSPFLCWADKPEVYLNSPIVDVIRSIPTTWDETIVLPGSRIGECAAFARRKNQTWWIGIINAAPSRDFPINFTFLPKGRYVADFYGDAHESQPTRFDIRKGIPLTESTKTNVWLNAGGGCVIVIEPAK